MDLKVGWYQDKIQIGWISLSKMGFFNEVFFIEQQVAATWDQNQLKDIDEILNPDKVASL